MVGGGEIEHIYIRCVSIIYTDTRTSANERVEENFHDFLIKYYYPYARKHPEICTPGACKEITYQTVLFIYIHTSGRFGG